jgi:hypothetical protein
MRRVAERIRAQSAIFWTNSKDIVEESWVRDRGLVKLASLFLEVGLHLVAQNRGAQG